MRTWSPSLALWGAGAGTLALFVCREFVYIIFGLMVTPTRVSFLGPVSDSSRKTRGANQIPLGTLLNEFSLHFSHYFNTGFVLYVGGELLGG